MSVAGYPIGKLCMRRAKRFAAGRRPLAARRLVLLLAATRYM